jgi:hypothetical protein
VIKTTYRTIAKSICAYAPVNDGEFGELVQSTINNLKSMGKTARLAVKVAYVFSRKVPREDREDMFQELVTAVLDSGATEERFAYTIARRDWQNWWQKRKLHSQYFAGYLSETVTDSDNEDTELAELLVGEVEFERKLDGKLDGERLWERIPDNIKPLVQKRLLGKPLGAPRNRKGGRPKNDGTLNNTERQRLNYWIKSEGYKLLLN